MRWIHGDNPVGGLGHGCYMTFHSVGNNHPNWPWYFSEGQVYHEPDNDSLQDYVQIPFVDKPIRQRWWRIWNGDGSILFIPKKTKKDGFVEFATNVFRGLIISWLPHFFLAAWAACHMIQDGARQCSDQAIYLMAVPIQGDFWIHPFGHWKSTFRQEMGSLTRTSFWRFSVALDCKLAMTNWHPCFKRLTLARNTGGGWWVSGSWAWAGKKVSPTENGWFDTKQ